MHQLLADYESARAAEVWLVDPKRRSVAQYVLQKGELELTESAAAGVISGQGIPVQIEAARLWQAYETGR